MSRVCDGASSAVRTPKPRTRSGAIWTGAALGLWIALAGAVGTSATTSPRWSVRELPVTTFVLVFPALGALAGYASWRRSQPANGEPAEGSPEAVAFRHARRRHDLAVGFAVGCGAAIVATALDFAWRGWLALGGPALMNALLFPYLCVLVAFNLSRMPGERLSLRGLRLRISTLMVLIGYLAVLLGVAVEGGRIGGAAQRYRAQRQSATVQAGLFHDLARKSAVEATQRLHNAEALRAGTIPDRILEEQKRFLRSLDVAKPEYRTYRYGLIADGEELRGRAAETNTPAMEKMADYYDQLVVKYARAERQPWKPVAPDRWPPP